MTKKRKKPEPSYRVEAWWTGQKETVVTLIYSVSAPNDELALNRAKRMFEKIVRDDCINKKYSVQLRAINKDGRTVHDLAFMLG